MGRWRKLGTRRRNEGSSGWLSIAMEFVLVVLMVGMHDIKRSNY